MFLLTITLQSNLIHLSLEKVHVIFQVLCFFLILLLFKFALKGCHLSALCMWKDLLKHAHKTSEDKTRRIDIFLRIVTSEEYSALVVQVETCLSFVTLL